MVTIINDLNFTAKEASGQIYISGRQWLIQLPSPEHLVDKIGLGIILWSNRLKNLLISPSESESGSRD